MFFYNFRSGREPVAFSGADMDNMATSEGVLAMLRLCPVYGQTPLKDAPEGVVVGPRVLLKDETHRLGLGSFKSLGGGYAVLEIVREAASKCLKQPIDNEGLFSDEVKAIAGKMTFSCASAGNHGMAVAAAAKSIGAKAVIFIAKTVPAVFEQRLKDKGAEVRRVGAIYEDSMEAANKASAEHGWVLVSDVSWEGYDEIPARIMKGYSVIAAEIAEQCTAMDAFPSHVFLHAGVGGLAGGIANYIRRKWPVQPKIIIVEPAFAPCLFESAKAGKPTIAKGPVSLMGRLDCLEPSIIGFDVLYNAADAFMTIKDEDAVAMASDLSDAGLGTTPSGAAGLTGLGVVLNNPFLCDQIALDENSVCLAVISETSES